VAYRGGFGGPPPRNSVVLTKLSRNKVPKIKKSLVYEMKFLVPNWSCLHNHWLGGLPTPDPRSLFPLSSTEFVALPNKIPGYATGWKIRVWIIIYLQRVITFFDQTGKVPVRHVGRSSNSHKFKILVTLKGGMIKSFMGSVFGLNYFLRWWKFAYW
jgi:hypothetical protein